MSNEPNPTPQPPVIPTDQQPPNLYQPPVTPSTEAAPVQGRIGDNAGVRLLLPVGRSGWAIAAGYLGLLSVTGVLAPLALIISLVAIWDIRRSKGSGKQKHGLGRAIFGLIMGIIFTIALVFIYANITTY